MDTLKAPGLVSENEFADLTIPSLAEVAEALRRRADLARGAAATSSMLGSSYRSADR
jgi:hypothetical protein